jgi:hypothetical protein
MTWQSRSKPAANSAPQREYTLMKCEKCKFGIYVPGRVFLNKHDGETNGHEVCFRDACPECKSLRYFKNYGRYGVNKPAIYAHRMTYNGVCGTLDPAQFNIPRELCVDRSGAHSDAVKGSVGRKLVSLIERFPGRSDFYYSEIFLMPDPADGVPAKQGGLFEGAR